MLTTKNFEAYKFVIVRLKALICDEYGNPEYMEPMDDIIFDLFGVKQFTRKIARRYDNRDIARVIDTVGIKYLMELLNNAKYYAMLNDMTQMLYHLEDLKRLIRKQSRKGKRDRNLIKEYNYLNDLYKRALKYLRKRLNIKNPKTAYKRRYQALDGILKKSSFYGDDYSSIGLGGFDLDDPYDDDYGKRSYYQVDEIYDDFDDDFDDGVSPYDEFIKDLRGKRDRRTTRRGVSRKTSADPSEFEEYDPYDDEDYPDDAAQNSNVEDRIDRLADVVMELSSGLNNFMVKQSYDQTHPIKTTDVNVDHYDKNESGGEISDKLEKMEDTQKLIAGALGELLKWKQDLEEILFEEEDDENPDTSEKPKFDPTKYPDVYEEMQQEESSEDTILPKKEEPSTVGDLVDAHNHETLGSGKLHPKE